MARPRWKPRAATASRCDRARRISQYPQPSYTHQGWLTEDQSKLLFGDETINLNAAKPIKFVLDLAKLDKATSQFSYAFSDIALSHNLYILGDRAHWSNYGSGLRVLDL